MMEANPTQTGSELYITGCWEDLESIQDYEKGGHHPVHLGDMLGNRYKVIHKLGHGGYANVWLCRDASSSCYVAVKIIMADGSHPNCPEKRVNRLLATDLSSELIQYFCLPLEEFIIYGPNGIHFALVYPVLGPRISNLLHLLDSDYVLDLGSTLRTMALHVTKAMAILHSHRICHGDFRPANILLRIEGLDSLSEDEMLDMLGRPETSAVLSRASVKPHTQLCAPQYLVHPLSWDNINVKFISNMPCLIDFGESYSSSSSSIKLGLPTIYCAPEQLFDNRSGEPTDIWALACTLFTIRTGRKLFETFDDDEDQYLYRLAVTLDKFPEPWWSKWDLGKTLFETGANGHLQCKSNMHEAKNNWTTPQRQALYDLIKEGLQYDISPLQVFSHEIADDEVEAFADLLQQMLKYAPEERLTVKAALEHPWFYMRAK